MQSDRHQHGLLRQDGYRRIEVITGQRRRRQWSDEEKARIVSESFAPGANVSAVARRHGVSCGLLHNWRGQARQAAATKTPFIPIALADGSGGGEDDEADAASCGAIEIELAGARVRVEGAVGKAALKTVLAALRETA
jgi:transposase